MKILIVGGAGYLGGAITDLLIGSEHKVRVYDNLLYEEEYRKPVDFIFGDVRDRKKLLPHLKWAEAVIWLAAVVGDGACALNPEIAEEVNQHSVAWFSKNFKGRIIFPSTCSVYGAQDGILDEKSKLNPLSVYASTKLAGEKYLENKNALVFRLGTLFGISDTNSRVRLDLVLNTMTARAYYDRKLKVFGGKQYRPLLHVRDVAVIMVDNLMTDTTGIFNLSKQNLNMLHLSEKVKKYFPRLKIEKVKMEFEDSRNYRVSADKAKKILNFKPVLDIDDGITEIKALLESGRIRDINSPRYSNQVHLSMYSLYSWQQK